MVRAYGSIASRQQGADRLAFSEDDFRRILAQAIDPNYTGVRPSTIRLGADIVLSRPISLNPAQYNVTIDGGRRFGIRESRAYTSASFFILSEGQTSDIEFVGIIFNAPTVANIFGYTGSAASINVVDISLINCNVIGSGIQMFGGAITAFDVNIHLDDAATFAIGPVANFTGVLQVSSFLEYKYYEKRPIIARNNLGVGFGTTGALRSVDINGAIRTRPEAVTLAGANPVLESVDTTYGVGDRTFFNITVDNATATGTMQLKPGYDGQIIILYFANSSTTMVVDDVLSPGSGLSVIDVNKNHTSKKPVHHETITFIYVDSRWVEVCRSEN